MATTSVSPVPQTLRRAGQNALDFAQHQVRRFITAHPDAFPLYTTSGKWELNGESWTNWCEGFLGGLIWILAQRTGDAWWRDRAEHYARLIKPRKLDRDVHDLGFLFWPTWNAGMT